MGAFHFLRIMIFRALSLLPLFFSFITGLWAQTQWASSVVEASSSYYDPRVPKSYAPEQALGMPNKLPSTGFSSCVWSPALQDNDTPEFIWVAFDRPMKIRQVAIGESFHPGSISEIFVYSIDNEQYRLYYNPAPKPIEEAGRMFSIVLDQLTPYEVASVKIVMHTNAVTGWNHIDAIAISSEPELIEAKINLDPSLTTEDLVIESLPKSINSPHDEVLPVLSPDGKTLYFDRKNHPDNMMSLGDVTKPNDDIWRSQKKVDGTWGKPERMPAPLNNGGPNYVCSVSEDGKRLLLGNKYLTNGNMSGGVSLSYFEDGRWAFPEALNIDGYENLNASSDFNLVGDILLLSIQKQDTYGQRDLYVSFWNDSLYVWTKPLNLGTDINTAGTELTPFLAQDTRTLFFASNGHSGYGSTDIFKAERLDDSWTSWSRSMNLGEPLNSPEWDASFSLDAEGKYAYINSFRNGNRNADIFRVKLAGRLAMANFEGKALDAQTDEPLQAKVNLDDFVTTTNENGIFTLSKVKGKKLTISAKGYLPLHLSPKGKLPTIFRLQPLKVGETVTLEDVRFERGKAEILKSSYAELSEVLSLMEENPSLKIRVAGHTDIEGSPIKNMKLSEMRVEAIKSFLIDGGIVADRIEVKPYGATRPITRARDEASKRKNRRVEFEVLAF